MASAIKPFIGIPVNRDFPWQTTESLIQTIVALKNSNIPFNYQMVTQSSIVDKARNVVVDGFLQSDCTHLFWIDSDQSWQASAFGRLLALGQRMNVVGAVYPAKKYPISYCFSPVAEEVETNEFGCIPVKGLGLGFCIMQRHVIEALAEKAPKATIHPQNRLVAHVFRTGIKDGTYFGEDMMLFDDIRELGITPYVDPTITIGHVGGHVYEGNFLETFAEAPQSQKERRIYVPDREILLPMRDGQA